MIIQVKYIVTLFLLLTLQTVCNAETSYLKLSESNQLTRSFSDKSSFIDTLTQEGDVQLDVPQDIAIIFDKMKNAAYTRVYTPKLVLIKTSKQDMASLPPQALPDGSIILSDKFVDLAREYGKGDSDLFKAFMAFIIGHELAHLANDDFKRKQKLDAQYDKSELALSKEHQTLELEADEEGFLYAAFAGYKVGLLIGEKVNFFEFLFDFFKMKQAQNKELYPSPALRAAKIDQLWRILDNKYTFYEYGVRFSIFDQCADAISYFFQEFRRTYSGKEVQNNIGVCYLQLAKADMGDIAYFYWLPNILDGDINSLITMGSTVTNLQSLKSARLSNIVKGNLEAAIAQFNLTKDIDPYYFPSYFNLAIAYLYLGEPNLANLTLNEGFRRFKELDATQQNVTLEIQFKMLILIAQHESMRVSSAPFQNVLNGLRQILNDYKDPPLQVEFNLARLLEIAGRKAEAQEHWDNLRHKIADYCAELPKPIQEVMCNEQQGISGCMNQCRNVTKTNKEPKNIKQWSEPVDWKGNKGSDILDAVMVSSSWKKRLRENWYNMLVSIYQTTDQKWEALFFGKHPIQLINKAPNETLENLSQYCPHTLRKKTLVETEVYLCENWAAKVIDRKVVEVWIQAF